MARIVRITVEKIRVRKSEEYERDAFGLGGEAGGSAEWALYFSAHVDGKFRRVAVWEADGVRDNSEHVIDQQLDLELDGVLSVEVQGHERDVSSGPDELPSYQREHAAEPGWDNPGGIAYQKTRASGSFRYTIYYRIETISQGATLTPGQGQVFDVRYSGLWNAGSQRREWSDGLTAAEVNEQAAMLWKQGGRLAQLQAYTLGGRVHYNVIWRFDGRRQLWNLDCDEAHFGRTTGETWSWARPAQVSPFVVNGHVRYACIWDEGAHGQVWHPNVDDAGLRRLTGEHWSWARPHQALAFIAGGQLRYACLWNAGQQAQVWHPNCDEASLMKLGGDNWAWGRAHQIQPFMAGGQRRYSVLWNAGQQGQLWNVNCDGRQLVANARETAAWARPRQVLAPSLD